MIGERLEALELLIDGLREDEGVEALAEGEQGRDLRPIMLRGGLDPVERHLGGVVATAQARPDPQLGDEFDRGQEEGLEQPELVSVERIVIAASAAGLS